MRFGGIRFHFRPLIFNTPKLGEFGGGEISHIFKNIINYLFFPDVNLLMNAVCKRGGVWRGILSLLTPHF